MSLSLWKIEPLLSGDAAPFSNRIVGLYSAEHSRILLWDKQSEKTLKLNLQLQSLLWLWQSRCQHRMPGSCWEAPGQSDTNCAVSPSLDKGEQGTPEYLRICIPERTIGLLCFPRATESCWKWEPWCGWQLDFPGQIRQYQLGQSDIHGKQTSLCLLLLWCGPKGFSVFLWKKHEHWKYWREKIASLTLGSAQRALNSSA